MGTGGPGDRAEGEADHGGAGGRRLRWYPSAWRSRYGDELAALLEDLYGDRLPARVRLGLAIGGLRQRARESGLTGDGATASDRIRAGAMVVLAAWTAFVVAGASFAKFSEHFDGALPRSAGAHRVPDLAFTVLRAGSLAASLLVAAGALLAMPAFVRFLRAGGWTSVRGHVVRAVTVTALAGVATGALVVWAHHLPAQQRNDGLHWYGVAVLSWAALLVLTLALWTLVAVAAGRRVELSPTILVAEAWLAVATAVAMVVVGGATVVWWGAMASDAPGFLTSSPGGAPGSPWDIWLTATVALMAMAVVTAAVGVAREARVWSALRHG